MDTVHDDNVYLGLGSNLGNRPEHLRAGLAGLRDGGLRLRAVSSFYLTEPDLRATSGAELAATSPRGEAGRAHDSDIAVALVAPAAAVAPSAEARASGHRHYVNCVAAFEGGMQPRALLDLCLAVEDSRGRNRSRDDSGAEPRPRTLDIDVLMIGQRVINEPGLRVPHPLMMQRRFVLQPLAEIAPALRHPLAHGTISEALARLPEDDGVELLRPPPDGVI